MINKIYWTKRHNFTYTSRALFFIIACAVICIDQITKYIACKYLPEYSMKYFLPSWGWFLTYNDGAAFSFLANTNPWHKALLTILAIVVSVIIVSYLLHRTYSILAAVAFNLVLGGAIGNLIDRIRIGRVVDFIEWYYNFHYWPSFNVADSCITLGIALLFIDSLHQTSLSN